MSEASSPDAGSTEEQGRAAARWGIRRYVAWVVAIGLVGIAAGLVLRPLLGSALNAVGVVPVVPDGVVLISVIAGLALIVVTASGLWRRWIFWLRAGETPAGILVLQLAAALFLLTETFAAIAAAMIRLGWLTDTYPFDVLDPDESAVPHLEPFDYAEEYYWWHLADAIPTLDITGTFGWGVPRSVGLDLNDPANGALLLSYKVLVIVPIVGAFYELIERKRKQTRGDERV